MLRVKFFVKSSGWKDGGFFNTFYFSTRKEIDTWFHKHEPGSIEIREIEAVTDEEFIEDYTPPYL